jgi:hypothetical protein
METIQMPTASIKLKPKNLQEILGCSNNSVVLLKTVNNSDSIRKLIIEAARSIHLS